MYSNLLTLFLWVLNYLSDAVENAARLIIKLEHNVEDVLVAQARSFLETTFSALVVNLM